MKYFKLIRGYGAEDYISIDETELEKAQYAFLEKRDGVYSGGAVRGAEILAIQPDFHKIMGWNRGYKLGPDDFAELGEKGVERACNKLLSETKDKVQYLIASNQTDLIGKNMEITGFETSTKKLEDRGGVKRIGDII